MTLRPMLLLLVLGACPKTTPGQDAGARPLPPPLLFKEGDPNLLFSYVDVTGAVKSADTLADVPEDRRKNLMVVDLSKSPEERQADRFAFFTDATVKDPAGNFVAAAVSRFQGAAGAGAVPTAGTPAQAFAADEQSHDVIVYSAEWCGFCKKTKAYLKQKGIPFKERDVEKDPGAEKDLQAKAKRAGVRVSGVPVTDFMGELVMGFDQPRLDRLILAKGPAGKTGP